MILADFQIKEVVEKNIIRIDPFDVNCVEPATYDLRVGKEGVTAEGKEKIDISEKGLFLLEPGDFGVISSLEIVEFPPDYAGRFGIRSYYSRQGLFASTGPQVDPGFKGRFFITVINLSPNPIMLPFKDKFLSLEIHKLEEPAKKPYQGPYQNQLELSATEIRNVIERKGMSFSEIITTLTAMNRSMEKLTADVSVLKWSVPTLVAIGIAVISIIVSLK